MDALWTAYQVPNHVWAEKEMKLVDGKKSATNWYGKDLQAFESSRDDSIHSYMF